MKNDGKSFEETTKQLYDILTSDDRRTTVRKNVKLNGADGERQIDVLIETTVAGLHIRTIIECRDYNKRLDITHLDGLHSKMQDVNANKAVLVSRKGFSKKAVNKAQRLGITLCTLNNPEIELRDVGLELPVAFYEISKIDFSPRFLVPPHSTFNFKPDTLLRVNDVDLIQRIQEAFATAEIHLPTLNSELEWSPPELGDSVFLRDSNGRPFHVHDYSILIRAQVNYFFGYVSSLPGNLHLSDLSNRSEKLVFNVSEINTENLARFNSPDDFPVVPGVIPYWGLSVPEIKVQEGNFTASISELNYSETFEMNFDDNDAT